MSLHRLPWLWLQGYTSSFQQCVYITGIIWPGITYSKVWFTHSDCIQLHKNCTVLVSQLAIAVMADLSSTFLQHFVSPGADRQVAQRSILLVSPFSCALSCTWSRSTTVIESGPLSSTSLWYSKVRRDKTKTLSHSSLDCLAALPHTEIGKVTLMREMPTVNHWLAGLFTHSLKGSPFKFDQYQPKRSRRETYRRGY